MFHLKALFLGAVKAYFENSFYGMPEKKYVDKNNLSASPPPLQERERERNDNNEFPPHKMQMSKKSKKRDDYLESALERASILGRFLLML